MNNVAGSGRLGRLAISLALTLSNSTQIVVFIGSNHSTDARAAQQSSSNSNDRRAELDEKNITRARRAEAQPDHFQHATAGGPIIRVALMTDVSSVALSCSSGLIVRSTAAGLDEKAVSNASLTVELHQV
jgi:hypothetical protein